MARSEAPYVLPRGMTRDETHAYTAAMRARHGLPPITPEQRERRRLTKALRLRVLAEWGPWCVACGWPHTPEGAKPSYLHIDHIVAIARGGKTEFDNLIPLCPPCNNRKGVLDWDEFYELHIDRVVRGVC